MPKETSVSFNEAVQRTLNLVIQKPHSEWVSIFHALGRTLCADITCKKNLPSYNNAALDGFAFKYAPNLETLKIKTTILAGDIIEPCLGEHDCYKIMTGAKVPNDADTVIPFEECVSYDTHTIQLPSSLRPGNALRLKGEEEKVGTVLLSAGDVLGSREIAILASQGISMVQVYKKLHIAVFSTGDELKSPWDVASEDEIYDINALALISLFAEYGFEAAYCGVIPDNLEAATNYFAQMKQYDVLVTSGGVSMGEADFVERALLANGFSAQFHGINIKPGKPTMMGQMGNTIVASMPGNPLAAYVNAFVFLVPLLKKLQGQKKFNYEAISAINQEEFSVKSGRVNFVLGFYHEGKFQVFGKNKYGSGMIKPLKDSNALWISDEGTQKVEMGERINILLL